MNRVRLELENALKRRTLRWSGRLARLIHMRENQAVSQYELMSKDNLAAPPVYQPGRFWRDINCDFSDLIYAGALKNQRNQYFNRRFAGPDPCSRQVYSALLVLYRKMLLAEDSEGFLSSVSEPSDQGDLDQELIAGRRISLDFLQSVDEAFRIREAWSRAGRAGQPRVIVELGAGYGRLAYVCRKMYPECTYVVVDLPEALTCSSSWLSAVLPGEVVPYAEARTERTLDRTSLVARRVWMLAPQHIEKIAAASVDVFVNVYSFAEMPPASIDNYFRQLVRITSGVFYTKQRKVEDNALEGTQIREASYPVRPNWRELYRRDARLYESFFEAAYDCNPASHQP